MHVNHKADDSNGDTEYNSKSDNEYDNNSEPMPGACFHQVYHHMKNDTRRLNPYWILLNNQSTVHIFSNHVLLADIKEKYKPIGVYSSGGATHCSMAGTLKNIGVVFPHKNGPANILSDVKVKDKHNITYDDVRDIFTVHTPYKRIHFQGRKRGIYYHNYKPNVKKCDVMFVHTFQEKKEGFTNIEIRDAEKSISPYNMVGRPSAADFERMVRGNMLKKSD